MLEHDKTPCRMVLASFSMFPSSIRELLYEVREKSDAKVPTALDSRGSAPPPRSRMPSQTFDSPSTDKSVIAISNLVYHPLLVAVARNH